MVLSTIDENLALFNNGSMAIQCQRPCQSESHTSTTIADSSSGWQMAQAEEIARQDHCYLTQASVMSPRWRL
jgi:hypothetical protein